MVDIVHVGVI